MRTSDIFRLSLGLICVLASSSSLHADTFRWYHWSTDGTPGSWTNYANWQGSFGSSSLPNSGSIVSIDNGAIAQINSGQSGLYDTLYVGEFPDSGQVNIVSGASLSGRLAYLGYDFGTAGTVVSSGTWTNLGNLYVGHSGTGNLQINAGLVSVNGTAFTGLETSGRGTIELNSGTLSVRRLVEGSGTGALKINGGVLQARADESDFLSGYGIGGVVLTSPWILPTLPTASIDTNGYDVGISSSISGTGSLHKMGAGTLTLSGSNSYNAHTVVRGGTLTVTAGGVIRNPNGTISVGSLSGDNASFRIDGGRVSSVVGSIGNSAGSTGVASVLTGTWTMDLSLSVGKSGTGSLLINGGQVSNVRGYIAESDGSTGSVTVTSGTWANSSWLDVGHAGTGSLLVNGGLVSSTEGLIGRFGTGSVTVTSGTWANSSHVLVGYTGRGDLLVNGGLVSNSWSSIGHSAGSSGTATVSSGTWANSGDLSVGNEGFGTLLINGGLVNVSGTVFTGRQFLSYGSIQLQSGTLSVGRLMQGSGYMGYLTLNGGVLQARAHQSDFISGYSVVGLDGSTSVDSNGYDIGIASPIGGAGALTKLGEGTLSLSGENTYDGGTTVRRGTLAVASGASIRHIWTSMLVGYSSGDNAALLVNGGLVSSADGLVGQLAGSTGSVTVSSGTWTNSANVFVGNSGTGTLLINGGLVSVNATAFTGYYGAGNGSIHLQSGTLSVRQLMEGSGTGRITLNGGVLQARVDQGDFLYGYESGDVTIGSGGAVIDSNGYGIGIATALSGTGRLTKVGSGTLILSGANSYGGGTTVSVGTLVAQHNHAVGTGAVAVEGGEFHIGAGVNVNNAVELAGGTFSRAVTGALAGAVDATSDLGGTDTTASLLAGTTESTTLVTSFSVDEDAFSDVYHLEGTGTSAFVLELSFASLESGLVLGWNDEGQWVNAVEGNSDNMASGGMLGFNGSYAEFQIIHGADLALTMGAYGSTTGGGLTSVWAVLNHNSKFAAIPEPSAILLVSTGLLLSFLRRRR